MRNLLLAFGCVAAGTFLGAIRAEAQGWTMQNSGTTLTLYEVKMADSNTATAVGQFGTIRHTTDGGATWVGQTSGTTTDLFAVKFPNLTTTIAVGNNGLMLRTTNSGATWDSLPQVVVENLRGISFTEGVYGIVVGTNGTILKSTNAGESWAKIRGVTSSLYEVYFVNSLIGTVVGGSGTILKTTDGGSSWVPQTSGTFSILLGVSFSDLDHGTVVGGNGVILRTTNGGVNWFPQSSGTTATLTSVTMIDQNLAYAVGDSGLILRTGDGGNSWGRQTSGTAAGLKEISFATADIGLTVGTGGAILHTSDGGGPTLVTRSYPMIGGWNLVSIPLTVGDYSKGTLFPTASSDAFSYDTAAGYVLRTTLQNGVGYWLKFDTPQNVTMSGYLRNTDSIDVGPGWNLVGSVSGPVPVASVITIPPGNLAGGFYEFDSAYAVATTVVPGRAYWAKFYDVGKLVLVSSSSQTTAGAQASRKSQGLAR